VTRTKRTTLLSPRNLFLVGIFLAILRQFVQPIFDPDFWWHLRTGQWILDNHALPTHDLYTFTVSNHAWTTHEYLIEVIMWLAWSYGGNVAISVGFGLLTWWAFWFIYKTADGPRQPFVIVGTGLALGTIAGAAIWGPRSQMITFFFSCLQLYWLEGYLRGRSRALQWFPLLMVLWTNLHGGFVIAFVWFGIAIVAEGVHWFFDRESQLHRRHLRMLGIVTAASALAVVANPHGIGLYLYSYQTQFSPAQQKLIVEWFSPDFHEFATRPFELMILLLVVGFTVRRPSLYQLLLTMATLVLALQSVRHIVLFVAATTPVLIAVYADIWRLYGLAAWRRFADAREWRIRMPERTPLLAIVIVLIAGVVAFRAGQDLTSQDQFTRTTYPVAAADWLAAHPDVGTRMYNQYGWGGYLVYRFYPDSNRRVFAFGEAALMGDDFLREYQDVQTLRPNWQQILDKYHVDYVVYNKGEALANVLASEPDRWTLVYSDDVAVIYVRRSNTATPSALNAGGPSSVGAVSLPNPRVQST
jgi:hypothetical protein